MEQAKKRNSTEILKAEARQKELIVEKEKERELAAQRSRTALKDIYSYLKQANQKMVDAQKSRGYKFVLLLRKTINQLRSGGWDAKKDLVQYFSNKIFRTRFSTRTLYELNEIEHARLMVAQARNALENVITLESAEGNARRYRYKNTPKICILATIPYYDIGGGQRSAQLAKTFNQLGYCVDYYYAFDSSESEQFNLSLPTEKHMSIHSTRVEDVFQDVGPNTMFIVEAPCQAFKPYVEAAKRYGVPVVYEHIDNWETSLGSMVYDADTFKYLVEFADVLVATSLELKKQLNRYTKKPVHYLPNAVNTDLFEPDYNYHFPRDLVKGKEKTLLYFGSLWGEWFDWDLVRDTARACPDSTFNMIGDDQAIGEIKKTLPSNVVFLGLKKQTDLPAYLAACDLAILPFKNCEIGKYVSPLKIFEYIAMERFVLATPLPDIVGYPNTLCSDKAQDWIAAIRRTNTVENSRSFARDNSWYARCSGLLNACGIDLLDVKGYEKKISVIILNHNNMNVIFRCVDSLLQYNGRYKYEIIVVDNDSTDGSYERLKDQYEEKIKIIKNPRNGCSSGRNLGVKNASGDYFMFLDSDQWVVSDRWIDAGLHVLQENPSMGAVSWGAGWFESGTLQGTIVDYLPNRGITSKELFRDDISYLATSGFLISRKVFSELNGFDEEYDPTCFEDTDLSFQVIHYGYRIAFCPYMTLMHIPHQTTQSGSRRHSVLMERNGSYFEKKWNSINPLLYINATKYVAKS